MPDSAADTYRSVLRDVVAFGTRKRAFADQAWIDDIVTAYAAALDTGELDLLPRLTTKEAVFDYAALGGPRGQLGDVSGWLHQRWVRAAGQQHLITNRLCEIRIKQAHVVASYYNPAVVAVAGSPRDGGAQVFRPSGGYLDVHLERRLSTGWRISALTMTETWRAGDTVSPPTMNP
jgi:hypothetical protein